MAEQIPDMLALDFDGVICDGLIEYFQTSWKAYCQIWQPTPPAPPDSLAEQFYRLRPVIETGWEMPVLLRSLLLGVAESEILQDWQSIVRDRLQAESLDAKTLGQAVDGVRDRWISDNLDDWLSLHRFYPGVLARLNQILQSSTVVRVISTKEGRFIRRLLAQQGVELADDQIFGKEVKQPKAQTLRDAAATFQREQGRAPAIWFVEDRLKTLESIQAQPDLNSVKLFLADWGYNTEGDRQRAQQNSAIALLSLDQFAQDFPHWPKS
jgi:phosphoglycolate phosphatase-like HAD superfamily hydrolase